MPTKCNVCVCVRTTRWRSRPTEHVLCRWPLGQYCTVTSGNVLRELPEIIREEGERQMDGENCWSKQKRKKSNCNHRKRNVSQSKGGTLVMEWRRKSGKVREWERLVQVNWSLIKKQNTFWAFVNSRALSHDLLRQKSKGRTLKKNIGHKKEGMQKSRVWILNALNVVKGEKKKKNNVHTLSVLWRDSFCHLHCFWEFCDNSLDGL